MSFTGFQTFQQLAPQNEYASESTYMPLHMISSVQPEIDDMMETGVYYTKKGFLNSPTGNGNHCVLFVNFYVGTPFQLLIGDNIKYICKRNYSKTNSEWGSWYKVDLVEMTTT